MLAQVHIVATKSDIEDCHRLGKNGNTIVWFISRKIIWLTQNSLQPTSCLEIYWVKKSQEDTKVWSMKAVIKIRQSLNEQAYSINNNDDVRYVFPDFIFKESNTPIWNDNFSFAVLNSSA